MSKRNNYPLCISSCAVSMHCAKVHLSAIRSIAWIPKMQVPWSLNYTTLTIECLWKQSWTLKWGFFPTYVVIVLQTYHRFYCKTISKWAFRAFGLLFILTHKWTCVIYITYMSFAIYLKTSAYRVKVIAIIFDGALFSTCLFWLQRM